MEKNKSLALKKGKKAMIVQNSDESWSLILGSSLIEDIVRGYVGEKQVICVPYPLIDVRPYDEKANITKN